MLKWIFEIVRKNWKKWLSGTRNILEVGWKINGNDIRWFKKEGELKIEEELKKEGELKKEEELKKEG